MEFSGGKGLSKEMFQEEFWRPIHYLTSVGDLDGVKSILSQGEDANITHTSRAIPQLTPLHIASASGNIDMVNLLLKHSEVNKSDQYGYTALHYATVARRREVVSLLLSNGASAALAAKSGNTALDLSTQLQYDDISSLLTSKLTLESDPTIPQFKQWLAYIGGSEYMQRFLDAGYDLPFIHTHGLSDVDLDCVGVPVNKMGLRRKMTKLHGLDKFYVAEAGDDEDGDEEGSAEEEEEAESDED